MRVRTIVAMLLACTLLACSQFGDRETFEVGSEPPPYHGETSLEERIANSHTVVKGTLDRVTSDVIPASGHGTGNYLVVVKFHIDVSEYLNGTGDASITGVWGSSIYHATRGNAERAISSLLAQRDTSFDDREAIFFLATDVWDLFAALESENVYVLSYSEGFEDDDLMSVSSIYNRVWLPAVDGGTGTGDSQEFMLALPEPATAQTTSSAQTITIGALKTKIAAVNTVLNAGDGSEAYRKCVRNKYEWERFSRHSRSEGWEHPRVRNSSHSVTSGAPDGTVIYEDDEVLGHYPDQKFNRTWLDDGDAALFEVVDGSITPREFDHDGVLTAGVDWIAYTQSLRSKRPLPAGEYTFNIKDEALGPITKLCYDVSAHEWTVTATSFSGAFHEFFFDPVTVGTTVGADATNGVLKPTSFTSMDGTPASVESMSYEAPSPGSGQAGRVRVKVVPWGALSGVLDVIELDGMVSTSLRVTSSVVDVGSNTFTWSVPSQPWEDGDRLMVRIRRAEQ